MWKLSKLDFFGKKYSKNHRGIAGTFIITVSVLIFLAAIISLSISQESGYSDTTDKCISCHNDSTYPNDTNGDGVSAPYKRPHNDKVMCEKCHRSNPHELAFIQSDGNYGTKSTAGSCPECHQTGIPTQNNSNFSTAFMIYSPLRHSSNIQNGSAWGNYWTTASPKSACIYCHNKTLHDVTPLGRVLEFAPDYVINTSIGANFTCAKCHYKGDANWSNMTATFLAAGLQVPPEITNGTNWNGISLNYFNHTIENYNDQHCKQCHGGLLSNNATMSEFLHNVDFASSDNCIGCHTSPQGIYPAIETASFGKHKNINNTEIDTLTDEDCSGCHYNITNMYNQTLDVDTRKCPDCHIDGNFSAPIIKNHKPPKVAISAGGKISTTAYCTICHNNSINRFIYSENASVSHYMTNESLVKTVNQTSKPRFGFMTSGETQQYNKECNNCHNPSNTSYGNATLITMGHIGTATCDQCHVNGNAPDLHNNSLGMPLTFNCNPCHTTYATKYGAPNITGLTKGVWSTCNGGGCHGVLISDSLDTVGRHNLNLTFKNGKGGNTDTVYLNNNRSLTVIRGTLVSITSMINDVAGLASKVGGAEYYINDDPGLGKGIPMNAFDGYYNAVNGAWESVNITLDTSTLSDGNYTVFVRGMDIGKQWSATKNATLIVESYGYINGTVMNSTLSPISGAIVSTIGAINTTYPNGNYSLRLHEGNYTIETSKLPEYYGNTSSNINVTPSNTTIFNPVIQERPKGSITGNVTAAG